MGCSGEPHCFFEMSQALLLTLVEHSKKVEDLLPIELSFFPMEGESEIPLDRCTHCCVLSLDVVHSDFCSHCYLV